MHGAGGCFFLSLLRGGMIDSLLTWGLSVFLLEHLLRVGSSCLLKDPSPSGSNRSSPSIIEERPGSCSEDFFPQEDLLGALSRYHLPVSSL